MHREEQEVKDALHLPRRECIRAFALMKKSGIFNINREKVLDENPQYIRERNRGQGKKLSFVNPV